jgi:hypothetical protein
MKNTPLQLLMQFAHVLQQDLFDRLEPVTGPLPERLKLVIASVSLAPLQRLVSLRKSRTGRPAKDRVALATAFLAKAALNLNTTRDLIARLKVDPALRQLCG